MGDVVISNVCQSNSEMSGPAHAGSIRSRVRTEEDESRRGRLTGYPGDSIAPRRRSLRSRVSATVHVPRVPAANIVAPTFPTPSGCAENVAALEIAEKPCGPIWG